MSPVYEQDALLLLEHLKTGQLSARAFVYEKYRKQLMIAACMILRNEDEARDVVQQFYADFFQKRMFRNVTSGSLTQYLEKAVHNRCLNRIRDNKSKKRKIKKFAAQISYVQFPEFSIDKHEHTSQLSAAMNAAFQELPLSAKALSMRYLENKSREQIAEELGVTVNTVKNNMQRCLKFLRENLKNT